jgi:hypothetical protein
MLDAVMQVRPEVQVEVQAVQVGPAVFVSNPAEYFVQYGLEIKKGSKFPFTFPVELANGIVGYVPTEEAMGPNGGGYETRLSSYSNLEVSAGRQFANTGIELANQMTPGRVPVPPPAPPFRAPWAYGNLPPEMGQNSRSRSLTPSPTARSRAIPPRSAFCPRPAMKRG